MATPKDPIETLITFFTKQTATLQTGIYTILWGAPVKATQAKQPTAEQKSPNFLSSGLYNILDTINGVDLCDVLSYLTTTVNIKQKPRPEKSTWTNEQKVLYAVQDTAKEVQNTIDRYLALPTSLVRSYTGIRPQIETNNQAVTGSGAPVNSDQLAGRDVVRFNVYNLMQNLKEILSVLTPNSPNSIFTPEDSTLVSQVPGLGNSLNFLDDFTGFMNQYTDYRNINNEDLQKLLQKINQVRSICVTIQTLDFKSAITTVGNFLGTDIRAQIQKLSKVFDPTKLIPTLKQVADAVSGFARIAQKVYNILTQLQFIIKLALLLIKVFKFIQKFFISLPLPSMFVTHGITAALESAKEAAKDKSDQVVRRLEQTNGLLVVLINFVRYVLVNTNQILAKLQILITKLEACELIKDSPVLDDLKASYAELKTVQEQLATYIAIHDGKNSPDNALFGVYSIRVVDEELTELTVKNKRRRGIALDPNGALVAQSDLTFATNTAIIIEEVKVKLLSLGLVSAKLSTLDQADLAVIATSVSYLETDTVLGDDFNFDNLLSENIDPPDGSDENQGLGLNAFINNLKGGRKLRKRVRAAMDNSSKKFQAQIAKDKVAGAAVIDSDKVSQVVGVGSDAEIGNVTAQQRLDLLRQYKSKNPIQSKVAEEKLIEDEKAGGPGRKADPKTGL